MYIIHTKSKLLLSIFLLLIVMLSACKQTEQPEKQIGTEDDQQNITYTFENPDTGQEFSIIHAYRLYENYFAAVNDQPDEPIAKLFQQEVIAPVHDVCFKDAEMGGSVSFTEMITKRSEFDRVKKQIASINTDQLNEVFEESLVKSSNVLPADENTAVCIFPEYEEFPSDMGAIGSGKVVVFYERFDRNFKSSMAHEYHHSVWLREHLKEKEFLTGLDHVVMEGEAVMFETVIYPEVNNMYALLDESFNKEHWSSMEPYLEERGGDEILDFIIGGTDGLPVSYGYSEGYKIVRSYLDLHPDMTVEEWTLKDPKEIYEEVDYIANYR